MNVQENQKREAAEVELEHMEKKKTKFVQVLRSRSKSADQFAEDAETKNDITLYAKANSLRKTTEVGISALGQEICNFVASVEFLLKILYKLKQLPKGHLGSRN